MKQQDFLNLDQTTQTALIISMFIRNEMEDFHCKHLSDSQMKELNPIIRQAVYDILTYLKLADTESLAQNIIDFQTMLIPSYWELPNPNSPKKQLEFLSIILQND